MNRFLYALDTALKKYNYTFETNVLRGFLRSACSWYTPQKDYTHAVKENWWISLLAELKRFCLNNGILECDAELVCMTFRENACNYEYSLYDDAEEILAYCKEKGYKNYLLSNNFPELVNVVERFGLKKYFCDYILSANIGYEKPRVEIFEYALTAANDPEISYMIGDNPFVDVEGAKQVGMKTVLVHRRDPKIKSDYYFDDLIGIKTLIVD